MKIQFKLKFNTFLINSVDLLIVLTMANKLLLVIIYPGTVSSVFSLRKGGETNKYHYIDFLNNNYLNNNDDWYDKNSDNNTNYPDEQVLIYKLLKNYDPAARPVFNASRIITVKFSFSLIQICDMV